MVNVAAVPLAAATAVLVRWGLERYLESGFYLGSGESPRGPAPPAPGEPHT
mgnify:CR=1 FL=1